MNIERIPIGIRGLDAMIENGLEKGSITLITGESGTGKTTIGLQFIYAGLLKNEGGIYVTFDESSESIRKSALNYGWNLKDFEDRKMLKIIDISTKDTHDIKVVEYAKILEGINELSAKRVVIDSINSIITLIDKMPDQKIAMIELCDLLREKKCTSLLISDESQNISNTIGPLVDGIIALYNKVSGGDTRFRSLEVIKMRRTDHHKKRTWFKITRNGIQVDYKEYPIVW